MSELNYKQWFWTECDELNKDTSFAYSLAEKAWNHKKVEIDKLKNIIQMQEFGVEAIKQTLNEIYDACDEDETVSMLLDKIQELLK